jgi:hypothetical protein
MIGSLEEIPRNPSPLQPASSSVLLINSKTNDADKKLFRIVFKTEETIPDIKQ